MTIQDAAYFTKDEWESINFKAGNLQTDELDGPDADVVDKLFAGHRSSTSLGEAKPRILALLKQVRPRCQPRESLQNESFEILTDVQSKQMKLGFRNAVEDGVITYAWDDLRDFIYDRIQDLMECGSPEA